MSRLCLQHSGCSDFPSRASGSLSIAILSNELVACDPTSTKQAGRLIRRPAQQPAGDSAPSAPGYCSAPLTSPCEKGLWDAHRQTTCLTPPRPASSAHALGVQGQGRAAGQLLGSAPMFFLGASCLPCSIAGLSSGSEFSPERPGCSCSFSFLPTFLEH